MRSRGHTTHSWFRAGSRSYGWCCRQGSKTRTQTQATSIQEKWLKKKKKRGRSTPVGSWPAAFLHTQHFGGRNRTSVSPCEPLISAQEFGWKEGLMMSNALCDAAGKVLVLVPGQRLLPQPLRDPNTHRTAQSAGSFPHRHGFRLDWGDPQNHCSKREGKQGGKELPYQQPLVATTTKMYQWMMDKKTTNWCGKVGCGM